MSIELNWETLTSGPDGEALAERIRCFIHDKFQTVPLPRFIRSVEVHGFDFGAVAPELELKDVTDPLPDFYEQEFEDDDDDSDAEDEENKTNDGYLGAGARYGAHGTRHQGEQARRRPPPPSPLGLSRSAAVAAAAALTMRGEAVPGDLGSPFLGSSTPGILGGPGLGYFQGHLSTGTHTPLAAVAGAAGHKTRYDGARPAPFQLQSPLASHMRRASAHSTVSLPDEQTLREKSSVSTLAPTSIGTSRPPTRDAHQQLSPVGSDVDEAQRAQTEAGKRRREARADDVQAVFRIRYAGDVRLNLTAEILLDYPMPSFVGIPLKLNITGLSFDGVGVLAHIRRRLHFCFLGPEDAAAAVGAEAGEPHHDGSAPVNRQQPDGAAAMSHGRFAGLLQEIRVESEIGQRDGGKQSLKNVGKVERFVLEQVRRIFDEEFVYPSFWTILV
ncbi:hypothetical protein CDD82_5652 [Ophiocordyceps australis]|uniref:Mitochondrial distribution and morphology protein 12 n=1 Tax=Ophiocordyceps australis TaxID=1399860 RepID=A0A2C5Y3U4_9HYPO|nr:hypothetical protein CDD82_5652 [Ophiocordyceps australis]